MAAADHLTPYERSVSGETVLHATVVQLLADASSELDSDRDLAKSFIERAARLLRGDDGQREHTKAFAKGGLASWQVAKVKTYVEAHLATVIEMKDLAALTKLSLSHFCRAFKISVGEPPFSYIARRRIALAQVLMRTSDDKLCDIALACGMCDQSHFTRVFRRIVGISPHSWRREQGGDAA